MVNNSIIINNHLLPQTIELKTDQDIWCWKSRSWLGMGTKMWWG